LGDKNRKNVIIVGAGASKEFGLPIGSELTTMIADLLNIRTDDFGDLLLNDSPTVVAALSSLCNSQDIMPYILNAQQVSKSMSLAPSIDNYLDTHAHNKKLVEVGKLAITIAIIEAEKNSILYAYDKETGRWSLDFNKVNETWLGRFFKILVAQRTFDKFLQSLENITFISFNYDRCIHQFFYYASMQYFDVPPDDGKRVIDALNIIYPYGSVGDFTHTFDKKGGKTNFGQSILPPKLVEQSKRLKTFTESVANKTHGEINDALTEADIVMFLGFGFLGLNMKLIHDSGSYKVDSVLGTVKGQSGNNIQSIRTEISNHFEYRHGPIPSDEYVKLIDGKCADFMNEFNRLLMG